MALGRGRIWRPSELLPAQLECRALAPSIAKPDTWSAWRLAGLISHLPPRSVGPLGAASGHLMARGREASVGDQVPEAAGLLAGAAGLAAGSRVAGYVLEEQIGAGGMAVVFRARDERLGRPVALKILAPAYTADLEFRQRFIGESTAAAKVDDPHIIPVHEAGEAGGVLFIAMRYVPGGDVRTLLQREGPLPAARAAAIISPVASALDAAHAAGLVHRDVKPANMLVDARPGRPDHVYLSDFGLNKGAVSLAGLTRAGQFMGTPGYAAPEQIEGRAVDGRTDQYALACTAFELLTGEPPFQRDQWMAVIHAHLSQPPPLLTSRRPDLPQGADEVVVKALAKAPGDRYPSCREFADALRGALGLAPYDPRAPVIPPPVPRPPAGDEGLDETAPLGHEQRTKKVQVPRTAGGNSRAGAGGRSHLKQVWAGAAVASAAGLIVALSLVLGPSPSHNGPSSHRGTARTVSVYSGGKYGFSQPYGIAADGTHVWVANYAAASVTELNASDGRWVATLSGGSYGFNQPSAIAVAGGHVWVANGGGNSVTELNASDGRWVATLSGGSYGFHDPQAVAVVGTHVWVANYVGASVTELNAGDGRWVATLSGGSYRFYDPAAIAAYGAHLWVANLGGASVTELNASDGRWVATLSGHSYGFNKPAAIAVAGGHIWVANYAGASVTELNAGDGRWVATLSGGSYGFNKPVAIAADKAHVWIANAGGASVTELNAGDGRWAATLSGGSYRFDDPEVIAADGTHVWVANQAGNSVTELPETG